MSTYTFTKMGILKPFALDSLLKHTFVWYVSMVYSDDIVTVTTSIELDQSQTDELTTVINNYTDPEEFLQLNTTMTDYACSASTNATSPQIVQTIIYSYNTPLQGNSTLDAFKSVVKFSTDDVTLFSSETSATFTLSIRCKTRGIIVQSQNFDISNIILEWKALAENNTTGYVESYKSVMIQNLRGLIANYDCIWQLAICTSNSNITSSLNSLQSLYYDIL